MVEFVFFLEVLCSAFFPGSFTVFLFAGLACILYILVCLIWGLLSATVLSLCGLWHYTVPSLWLVSLLVACIGASLAAPGCSLFPGSFVIKKKRSKTNGQYIT